MNSKQNTESIEDLNRWIVQNFEKPEVQAEVDAAKRRWDSAEFACILDEATRRRLLAELRAVEHALHDPTTSGEHQQWLYVAQQVLAWIGNPEFFASPLRSILTNQPRLISSPAV